MAQCWGRKRGTSSRCSDIHESFLWLVFPLLVPAIVMSHCVQLSLLWVNPDKGRSCDAHVAFHWHSWLDYSSNGCFGGATTSLGPWHCHNCLSASFIEDKTSFVPKKVNLEIALEIKQWANPVLVYVAVCVFPTGTLCAFVYNKCLTNLLLTKCSRIDTSIR